MNFTGELAVRLANELSLPIYFDTGQMDPYKRENLLQETTPEEALSAVQRGVNLGRIIVKAEPDAILHLLLNRLDGHNAVQDSVEEQLEAVNSEKEQFFRETVVQLFAKGYDPQVTGATRATQLKSAVEAARLVVTTLFAEPES